MFLMFFFLHKVTSLYLFITAVGIMAYYLRYCYSLITNTFIINIFPPWVILSYILPTCVCISFLLLLPPVRSLISFSRCQGQSLTSAEYLLRRWKRSFARKVPQNCKQSRRSFVHQSAFLRSASEAVQHARRLYPGPDSIRTESAARSEANASLTVNVTF